MQRTLIVIFTLLILAGFIAALLFTLRGGGSVQQPEPSQPSFPRPGSAVVPESSEEVFSIVTEQGVPLQVRNFLSDQDVVRDVQNQGYYLISDASSTYMITYIASTQFFNISLLAEPIGEVRRAAEQRLMAHLGISAQAMCELRYTVAVPYYVNETYTSMDLRFSSCPGSVSI